MPKAKTTTEHLLRKAEKAKRASGKLLRTLVTEHGIDPKALTKKLTPAELRQELRAAADAHQKEQRDAHPGVDRVLRVAEVLKITGLGRTTLWKLSRAGQFPKSVPLTASGRAVGWRASEVARWVAGCYSDGRVERG